MRAWTPFSLKRDLFCLKAVIGRIICTQQNLGILRSNTRFVNDTPKKNEGGDRVGQGVVPAKTRKRFAHFVVQTQGRR